MKRATIGLLILTGSLTAAATERAESQVAVSVQLFWESGGGGYRTNRPTYDPRDVHYAPTQDVVYYTPRRAVRVPPGHLPQAGYCRVWYPGRPPGHQPRPERCERVFRRHYGPDVVILGAPVHGVVRNVDRDFYYDRDYYSDDDDYDDDRGRGRGNGNGRGRGRGGR